MMPLDEMYREIILDHYRSPRGRKPLDDATVTAEGHNPSCGDDIKLEIEMKDNILKDVHVDCRGCAISVASGSMLAEAVKGKTFAEVSEMAKTIRKMLKGELTETPDKIGDLGALEGVRQFPVRIKCALLAWVTLIEGLDKYADGHPDGRIVVTSEHDHE
jgi:nitrogen fixation protein NifU and related proteins